MSQRRRVKPKRLSFYDRIMRGPLTLTKFLFWEATMVRRKRTHRRGKG